jgi:iron complex transport system ATP-binding protein
VDLSLGAGEMVGLVGPNGAGKTTLLQALCGLRSPQEGEIRLDGRPLAAFSPRARARTMAYLPQGRVAHAPLPVRDVVALGRFPFQDTRQGSQRNELAVESALAALDLLGFADRDVSTLSDGERARVLLARAVAGEPKMLLADEPMAGLDPYYQLQVMEHLKSLADRGCTVLVTLHDLNLAMRFCPRLVVLHEGRVLSDGAPQQALSPPLLARAFRINAHDLGTGRSL